MKFRYVRSSNIKKLIKSLGKSCGADFLHVLDAHIEDIIYRACKQFNGDRKRLNAVVGSFIIGKK